MGGLGECAVRLIVGLLLNGAIVCMLWPLWHWNRTEGPLGLVLLCAAVGAMALVSLSPVLRHGTDRQKIAASVLMALPFIAFWPLLQFAFSYR